MNKVFKLFFLIFILFSCENNISGTENEKKSAQKVADFYIGNCKVVKGFESENTDVLTYVELEVSESTLLENNPHKLKLHSGNIAHLFYSNLKSEKTSYDEIRVKIITEKKGMSEFNYSNSELEEIEKIIPLIESISSQIKDGKFEYVKDLFEKSIEIEANQIAELFKNIENQFGVLKQHQLQGLEFMETENFGDVVKFNIVQIMEKENLYMVLIFNRKNKKLLSIEFE